MAQRANALVADRLREAADLLEQQNANPFRVRAYRNAARTVRALGRELSEMLAEGRDLTELSGIGKDLAAKIAEIIATGHAEALGRDRRRDSRATSRHQLSVPLATNSSASPSRAACSAARYS